MNVADAYRKSSVAAPAHTLLAKLHEQAGVFTQNAQRFATDGDFESARKNIQYVEDIIAFLRSSLDPTVETSSKTDAVYAYYYAILVDWHIHISEIPKEYPAMVEFWISWAETWKQVGQSRPAGLS